MRICSEIKATLKNKILPSAKIWFAIIQKIEKQYLFENKIMNQWRKDSTKSFYEATFLS